MTDPTSSSGLATARPPFSTLYFGKSDPIIEARTNASDFIRSYVDLNGAVGLVIKGERTLILGPKGTGKSALALYLEKTSGLDSGHFAQLRSAASLPLADIPQLKTGQPRGLARTQNAWRFILLANYLDVVLQDRSVKVAGIQTIRRILKIMREFGFMGDDSGKSLLQLAGKSFSLAREDLGSIFKNESAERLDIFKLVPYMEDWACSISSNHRHLLLLDGLDSIFLNDPEYDESLSGLAQAAYLLNSRLANASATGSIVLLLRNEIFSRISLILPDAHKMRDVAFDLDWRILGGPAGEVSPLIDLVNSKASQERADDTAIRVLDYFPATISIGGYKGKGRAKHPPRLQYLLNLTRHTPRDILQLMEYIRLADVVNPCARSGSTLSGDIIREGVLQYSAKYFVDAIRGELAGYHGGPEEVEMSLTALKLLDTAQFTRSDFRESLKRQRAGLEAKADEFLRLLFFAGALGNLFDNGRDRYMVFYHRRNDVEVNLHGRLVLHNALTHAWSRQFGMRP